MTDSGVGGAAPVTAVVLAAGLSRRLGTPKQLLPYRHTTLLGASLDTVRRCGFDRIILTLGGARRAVTEAVSLDGIDVVEVPDSPTGCSASLRVAVGSVDPAAAGVVLLLGDQPDVAEGTVRRMIAEGPGHPLAVSRYSDGPGHPFWLGREVFDDVAALHGDKGVWKLLHSGRYPVHELSVDAVVPLDVDTWDDYHRLVRQASP